MHAIQFGSQGGPEVLKYVEVPDPQPGSGEVLVATLAAGVNFTDVYHRKGTYPVSLPSIAGLEGAGRVLALGEDVTGLTVGDRIAWVDTPSSYAEQVVVPADRAVRVPDGVDDDVAGGFGLQGLTAEYLARTTFRAETGMTALVHAGAGGVGLVLTQILVHEGVSVITTVGSAEKEALSRAAGASHVLRYDTEIDIAARVRELTASAGAHVVYDGVGKFTFEASLASLRVRGMLVLFGAASGQVPPFDLQRLNPAGSLFVTRPTLADYIRDREELQQRADYLLSGVADGWLSFRIGACFELKDAADAHRALEARRTTGKVVLIP